MKDEIVKYETALLAKEVGFPQDIWCGVYYPDGEYTNSPEIGNSDKGFYNYENNCVAPTQSLLARWLREVHNKHIMFVTTTKDQFHSYIINLKTGTGYCGGLLNKDDIVFDTYEEALEAGLVQALNLLKNDTTEN